MLHYLREDWKSSCPLDSQSEHGAFHGFEETVMRKAILVVLLLVIGMPALAQSAGEQERNKQIARSFFEDVLDQGHFDKYAASHAADFVAHAGDHEATLQEDIAAAKEERKALPDMKVTVRSEEHTS